MAMEQYFPEPNSSASLFIQFWGKETCAGGHFWGPGVRNYFLIHFILKGKGTYQVNGQTYTLTEGMAFLIHPQDVIYYKADLEDPWEYLWISFGGPDVPQLLKSIYSEKAPYVYSFKDWAAGKSYLMSFHDAYVNLQHTSSRFVLLGYFYLIWSAFESAPSLSDNVLEKSYLRYAEQYISDNYGYPVTVQEIAEAVGVSRAYLYKIFIRQTKMSPKEFLTSHRIHAACSLLANTNLSVTEIALSCGFSDSAVFCKNFKALMHMTPRAYKKQYQS